MKKTFLLVIFISLVGQAKCQENFTNVLNGTIKMSDGSPAAGWNICVYGVPSACDVSDKNGKFQLIVPNEACYLKASLANSSIYHRNSKKQTSTSTYITKKRIKWARKAYMDTARFDEVRYNELVYLQSQLENSRNHFYLAKRANNLASYRGFLNTYSDSPYTDSVSNLYHNLFEEVQTEFKEVKLVNRLDNYKAFNKKYSNTVFADSSQYYINQILLITEEFIKLSEDLNFTDTDKVLQLIQAGSDINAKNSFGGTFLMMAAQEGHTEIAEVLLENGAIINAKSTSGNTAIYYASKNGKTEAVRLLLENGARVNIYENGSHVTPLFAAAQYGHYEIVEMLVNAGAIVNNVINTGRTPLMQAAQSGYTNIGSFLISKGADIDVFDKEGWSAIILAVQQGHITFVKMLIENNIDVNLLNSTGVSPIFMASQGCNTEIVRQLIRAKADVNVTTKNGATPLIVASQQEACYETVALLLKAGADASTSILWKGDSYTALELARGRGNAGIVKLLKQYGAQ